MAPAGQRHLAGQPAARSVPRAAHSLPPPLPHHHTAAGPRRTMLWAFRLAPLAMRWSRQSSLPSWAAHIRAVLPVCGGAAVAPHAVRGGGEEGTAANHGGAELTGPVAFTFNPSSTRRVRVVRSPSLAAFIRAISACGRSHRPLAHRRRQGARRVRVAVGRLAGVHDTSCADASEGAEGS